jgi:hypothetical protein
MDPEGYPGAVLTANCLFARKLFQLYPENLSTKGLMKY